LGLSFSDVRLRGALQGKYPEGLKAVEDDEVREFIQLCISHTPDARPDTRRLLKHSFFEEIRNAPPGEVERRTALPLGADAESTLALSTSGAPAHSL
jgi:serine/threonine protein kinase